MSTPQEIWSVRLQREIIALTTPPSDGDDNPTAPKDHDTPDNQNSESEIPASAEISTSSSGNDTKNVNSTIGVLPPFVSVEKHNMDIEKGVCQVWFDIEVTSAVKKHEGETKNEDSECVVVDAPEQTNEPTATTAVLPPKEGDKDDAEPSSTTVEKSPSVESITSTPSSESTPPFSPIIVTIVLDASLPQATASPTNRKKSIDMVTCYPFTKPVATLSSGAIHLPTGSTLQDGDNMVIDCDWTPSLHLRDAAVNVALKLREGIKRNEPVYKHEEDEDELRMLGEALSQGVSQGTQKMKSFFNSVKEKAAAVADDLDKAVAAERAEKEEKMMRQQQQKQVINRKNRLLAGRKIKNPAGEKKVVDGNNVEIGDSINLAMNPWSQAVGMHACKAIRRPEFVEAAIKLATVDGGGKSNREVRAFDDNEDEDGNEISDVGPCTVNYLALHSGNIRKTSSVVTNGFLILALGEACSLPCLVLNALPACYEHPQSISIILHIDSPLKIAKVAGSGVSATGSMFQSFRQSAKALVEESYLMLTPDHILEITCNKFSVATATVTYVIPVSSLAKLKFRRKESISLFFRQSPDDPAIYMCDTSAEAVKELQGVLKKYGVKGKHTNATMQRCVKSAIIMIDEIQAREVELEEAGEFENRRVMVEKIMNLYRQAAEQFELAGDLRHEEVMLHMHEFLAKPLVLEILDSKSKSDSNQKVGEIVPEGEILDPLEAENDKAGVGQESPTDGGDKVNAQESDDFHRAMQAAESMLKDAHDDLKDLGIDDAGNSKENLGDEFDIDNLDDDGMTGDDDNDVVTEFEDMLKDADKELAELMGS